MIRSSWISLVPLWITTYAFIWSILYNVLRRCIFSKEPSTFSARLVASIHALTVTSLSYHIWTDETKMLHVLGSDMTEKQADILAAILGYILFDFVWCLSCNCEPLIMKAHHFVCILLIVLVLSKGNTGAELIFIFGVNQVTNFLLQLRWFLRYHGFNNGIVEFLFVISFFVERVWLTFTLFDRIAKSSSVPLEFKIFLIFHCVIGYVFSYHVALLVLNKCCRSKNKPPVPSTISFDQYEDQGDFDDDDGVTEEEHCGKTKSNSLPYDKSNSPLYDKSNTPYDTDSECHCE